MEFCRTCFVSYRVFFFWRVPARSCVNRRSPSGNTIRACTRHVSRKHAPWRCLSEFALTTNRDNFRENQSLVGWLDRIYAYCFAPHFVFRWTACACVRAPLAARENHKGIGFVVYPWLSWCVMFCRNSRGVSNAQLHFCYVHAVRSLW